MYFCMIHNLNYDVDKHDKNTIQKLPQLKMQIIIHKRAEELQSGFNAEISPLDLNVRTIWFNPWIAGNP